MIVRDINFANIDEGGQRAEGSDGAEFVQHLQEYFLKQYADGGSGEGGYTRHPIGKRGWAIGCSD